MFSSKKVLLDSEDEITLKATNKINIIAPQVDISGMSGSNSNQSLATIVTQVSENKASIEALAKVDTELGENFSQVYQLVTDESSGLTALSGRIDANETSIAGLQTEVSSDSIKSKLSAELNRISTLETSNATLSETINTVDREGKAIAGQIVSQIGDFVFLKDFIWQNGKDADGNDLPEDKIYKALKTQGSQKYYYYYYKNNDWNETDDPVTAGCKVTSAGIITSINSAGDSQMKINADKINLTGYATFESLKTPGATEIDGGNIKTGSITIGGLSPDAKKYVITDQKYFYIITNDMNEPSETAGWIDDKPSANEYEGKALWRKTVTTYADNTTNSVIQLLVAIGGKDGKSVTIKGTAATAISISGNIEFNPSEDFVPDATLYRLYTQIGSEIDTNLVAGDGYLVKGYLFVAIFDENFQGFSCVGKIQGPQGASGVSVSEFITQYQWSESKISIRDIEEGTFPYDEIIYYKTYVEAETSTNPQSVSRYWADLTNEDITYLLETIIKGYVRDADGTISEITLFPYRREKTIYNNGTSYATNPYINVSDKNMAIWCAQEDITKIDGGQIYTNSITTNQLATDALRSLNYDGFKPSEDTAVDPNKRYFEKNSDNTYLYIPSPSSNPKVNGYYELDTTKNFSDNGSFFDLENGNIITPSFSVYNNDNDSQAYFKGTINATSGYISKDVRIDGTLSANKIIVEKVEPADPVEPDDITDETIFYADADKGYVYAKDLASISANLGIITSGAIQSENYGTFVSIWDKETNSILPSEPGLYNEKNELVASLAELEGKRINFEEDYTANNYLSANSTSSQMNAYTNGVTLVLNSNTSKIGSWAFTGCYYLKNIILPPNKEIEIHNKSFAGNDKNVCFYGSTIDLDTILIKTISWSNTFEERITEVIGGGKFYYYSEENSSGNYWSYFSTGFKISSDLSDNMIDSKYFKVSQEGEVEGTNCKFINGSFQGKIEAEGGRIGGFTISDSNLSSLSISIAPEEIFIPTDGQLNLNNNIYFKNINASSNAITKANANMIESKSEEDFIITNNQGAGLILKKTDTEQTNKLAIILSVATSKTKTDTDGRRWDTWKGTFSVKFTCYPYNSDGTINTSDSTASYNGPADVTLQKSVTVRYALTVLSGLSDSSPTETFTITIPRGTHSGTLYSKSITDKFVLNSSPKMYAELNLTQFDAINVSMTNKILYSIGSIFPYKDNGYTAGMLGDGSNPWATLATSNFVMVTSDRSKKNTVNKLSDKYSLLFDNLKPVSFKYNDGTSDRIHTGFIAQDVEDAINNSNLTTQDFGALIKNTNEQGNIDYSLRYEEFISLCVNEIQKLKSRVKELEEQLSEK